MNPDGSGNQPSYGQNGQGGTPYYGAPQPGYPESGYPQYGYQQPGPPPYPAVGQWGQPYGHVPQGYPQPGPGWGAPDVKVGTVPLRPLDLGGLYNGAFAAIRANPGVMVGLTAAFVVIAQLITFLAQIPLTRVEVNSDSDSDEFLSGMLGAMGVSVGVGLIAAVASLFLSGVLTIAVARSVMGERTGPAGAMRAIGPRILPLIGLSLLQFVIFLVPILLVMGLIVLIAVTTDAGPVVAILVALLLFGVLLVGYLAVLPTISLAFPAVVLERVGPITALQRGYALQRPGFWRVLGVLVLTYVISGVVTSVVTIPFTATGTILSGSGGVENIAGSTVASLALASVGAAIGQFLTVPFLAGVQTLLYVDQRMRNERFDQVLRDEALRRWQTGAVAVPTDALWQHQPQPAPTSWY